MLAVYTIVKPAAEDGWGAGLTLGLGAGAIALLVAFVAREATARNPLVPLRIFRSRNVSGANAIQALTVAGMFGTFFMGALYLQRVLGYDALQIGLAFLPATVVMGVLSLRYAETVIMRFGARTSLVRGLVLVGVALALFARAPVDGNYVVDVLPVMIILALGMGIAFPALMTLSMSGATPQDAGLASGLVNTSVQVGGALGLAVLATLSATRSETLIASGHSTAAALTGGYHLAFVIGAVLVAAAVVIGLTVVAPDSKAEGHAAREHAPAAQPACEPA
jgi:predicted MFS family arabinose efflux permease